MAKESLLDITIRRKVEKTMPGIIESDWFRKRLRWAIEGFEPGYRMKDRERFTKTVARRLFWKSRTRKTIGPVTFRWFRDWRGCEAEAEQIVTEWLRDERMKFGDDRFFWGDGHDLADEVMSYYEDDPHGH